MKDKKQKREDFEKGFRTGMRQAANWIDIESEMWIQDSVRHKIEGLADSIRKCARNYRRDQ